MNLFDSRFENQLYVDLTNVCDVTEWVKTDNHEYIGRKHDDLEASIWANPFRVGKDHDLDTCLELYEEHITNSPELIAELGSLKDKVLGCWCKNSSKCHSSVLQYLIGM